MEKKEETLSDKINEAPKEYQFIDVLGGFIFTADVKEFIKKLKTYEFSKTMGGNDTEHILISLDELDKLAGEKLI